MEDPFWFWSNVSMEQDIGGGGRRGYDIEGQEQEEMMKWESMMKVDDHHHHHHHQNTSTKKTKGKKGGRTLQRKPEKKNPKRGVGIAKLEETIKQKNSQLPAADRQVYHGYPTTSVASVLPTTYDNQSQSQIIQFHHLPPFPHHQQQKRTATVSSSSIDVHGANTRIIDGGHLNMNHDTNNNGNYDQVIMEYGSSATNVNGGLHQQPYVLHPSKQQQRQHGNSTYYVNGGQNMNHGVDININDEGGYDQVIMKYGSAATNVNGGLYHLMNSSHDHQQPYVLHPPSKQQQQHGNSTNYNVAGYNPSAGSGVHGFQHGNNNAAGFYSPKVVELSSTQKKEHYHDHLSQHSDPIGLNNQKNLNNGENMGGFTRYSKTNNKSADFLELNIGRNWNYNNVDFKKDSKAAGLLLRAGYSGLNNDQVELSAVHRNGKSSPSSSSNILMEYEFLSSTNGGVKGNHQFHTNGSRIIEKEYEPHYYSSNYSSSSCVMEESAASSSAVRKGSVSSSQSNSDHHGFLDLSLKLSSYH